MRFLGTAVVLLFSGNLYAQGLVRSWVSTTGQDTNPCTRSAPCRNFAAAIAAVNSGGEVVTLDSGGYGAVSITKSVALIAPEGIHAAIAPTSGTAISLEGTSSDVVTLRNLYLQSQGAPFGIQLISSLFSGLSRLHLEKCTISGFSNTGVDLNDNVNGILVLSMAGTVIRHCDTGMRIRDVRGVVTGSRFEDNTGSGLVTSAGINITRLAVRDSISSGNSNGYSVQAGSGVVRVSLENCLGAENTAAGLSVLEGIGQALVTVSHCSFSGNDVGILADGDGAVIRVAGSTITLNTTNGLEAAASASLQSRGDNTVEQNGGNQLFTGTFLPR